MIYDEDWNEVVDPDLTIGYISQEYKPINGHEKDEDYNPDNWGEFNIYHLYTDEQLILVEREKEAAEREIEINALPESMNDTQDALVEIADMVADNEINIQDISDALVELAALIDELMGE